jgi:signal transduction histidine kinase
MTDNRSMDTLRTVLIAGDDERRAIERRLHDGVQQQLVAVAVNLQVARGLVATDPQAAAGLLDEVRSVVTDALDELRELASGIHPSLLEAQGLVAALRAAAAAAPIPTRVEGAVDEPVPPEVALTVYLCCVATLAAARGEIARANIVVTARGGVVEFEIALTGARVDAETLVSPAARVEAFGGSFEAAPGSVTGRVPLTS